MRHCKRDKLLYNNYHADINICSRDGNVHADAYCGEGRGMYHAEYIWTLEDARRIGEKHVVGHLYQRDCYCKKYRPETQDIVDCFVALVDWYDDTAIIQLHDETDTIRSILYSEHNSPEKDKIISALNRRNSKILSFNSDFSFNREKGVCGEKISREGYNVYERTKDGEIVYRDGKPIIKRHVDAKECTGWCPRYWNSPCDLVYGFIFPEPDPPTEEFDITEFL